jgi:hypothetical protein
LFVGEIGILRFELPDLSVGAPAAITVMGIAQIRSRDRLEAPRSVETSRQLVGERLVLNKLVLACRLDSRFVEALGIQLSAFYAGDFRVDQQRAVLEILRTVLSPFRKLFVMGGQSVDMPPVLSRKLLVAGCRMAECAIEVTFCHLENGRRCPEQPLNMP